jgi:two-component system nitrate/nitrite response regulator NarL
MHPAVHNERVFGPSTPPASAVIRVFLAEDHHITLWGLRRLIEGAAPRMTVVGTASTREELLLHDAAALADVIVLDLDLAGEDMAAAIDGLRPRCKGHVLVLTAADDSDRQRAAVMKGARGVVHKSEPAATILRAIEKVSEGEVWLHRGLLSQVLGLLTSAHPGARTSQLDPDGERIASLTGREREIVVALLRSAGAKLISVADELCMSENTLRNHLTSIYSKLCVRGRLELHVYATTHGLGMATWGEKTPAKRGPSSLRDRVAISAA